MRCVAIKLAVEHLNVRVGSAKAGLFLPRHSKRITPLAGRDRPDKGAVFKTFNG